LEKSLSPSQNIRSDSHNEGKRTVEVEAKLEPPSEIRVLSHHTTGYIANLVTNIACPDASLGNIVDAEHAMKKQQQRRRKSAIRGSEGLGDFVVAETCHCEI
jgi:hypothetical protein